jgi:hypothetical protein
MWRFVSAGDSGKHPLLHSLNGHQGRQTWEFDPNGGTPEERAKAEALRAAFTADRLKQKSSSDELLRLQCADKIAAKAHSPPTGPLPDKLDEKRVAAHLKGAISFYECLQQDDGHWPGDYGGPMFLMPGLVSGKGGGCVYNACLEGNAWELSEGSSSEQGRTFGLLVACGRRRLRAGQAPAAQLGGAKLDGASAGIATASRTRLGTH